MSTKDARNELKQLLDSILSVAPDEEVRNRQRPITHSVFELFKKIKSKIQVTPEELEAEKAKAHAEKQKLELISKELSQVKALLATQKSATARATAIADEMRSTMVMLRRSLLFLAHKSVANAVKAAMLTDTLMKESKTYRSKEEEALFEDLLQDVYSTDPYQKGSICMTSELFKKLNKLPFIKLAEFKELSDSLPGDT